MTNSNHLAPSAPLFAQLNILDIFEVNFLYLAQFVFKNHHRLLPSPFLNLFLTGGQIHNSDTKTSAHFRPGTCRTDIDQSTNFTLSRAKNMEWFATLSTFRRKLHDLLLFYGFIVLPPNVTISVNTMSLLVLQPLHICKGTSQYKLGGFLRSPCHFLLLLLLLLLTVNLCKILVYYSL